MQDIRLAGLALIVACLLARGEAFASVPSRWPAVSSALQPSRSRSRLHPLHASEGSSSSITDVAQSPSFPVFTDADADEAAASSYISKQRQSAQAAAATGSKMVTAKPTETVRKRDKVRAALISNWLIVGEIVVIALAKANPAFGATGGPLRPEITISRLAVALIFFINGVSLSISGTPTELRNSFKTNLLVQSFSFGFLPLLARLLAPLYPYKEFKDGLLLLSVLPCTINICVAQTLSAGGNMGTAIFNAIFGNVLGVFLCPLLTVAILGKTAGISLLATLKKLGSIVILPLILGQMARYTPLGGLSVKYTKQTRTFSTALLLAIVYNIFSDTFLVGIGISGPALTTLAGSMPVLYLSLCALFWAVSKKLLPGLDLPTRAAAVLISPSKTLAFGIPFIKAAMGDRPDLAFILAPLLLYAPTQLLLGSSILVPLLRKKIADSAEFAEGGGI